MLTRTLALAAGLMIAALLAAVPAAADTPQRCAPTTDQPNGAPLVAGHPCWVDVTPYPFGANGTAITDPVNQGCFRASDLVGPGLAHGPNWLGDYTLPCYLNVTDMVFRAWNRGLAVTNSSAYRVWLYNGREWYPDPTFPGAATCPGNRIFWAGKLDYWLVGGSVTQKLCRFDGVNLEWEPLPVPKAAIAQIPTLPVSNMSPNTPKAASINDGGCFTWDNCWFVGDYGLLLHWDGQSLSAASSDLAGAPWDQSFLRAFEMGQTPSGPVGMAVGTSGTSDFPSSVDPLTAPSNPLPAQPDGSPPPQMFESRGAALLPTPYTPPTTPQPGDPFRTDLDALTVDAQGAAWAIGAPAVRSQGPSSAPTATLLRIGPGGGAATCPGYDAASARPDPALRSSSLGLATLAAGAAPDSVFLDETIPTTYSDTVQTPSGPEMRFWEVDYARLSLARCGDDSSDPAHTPQTWSFVMPDPFVADDQNPPPYQVPGGPGGVAVNAVNDAWASTSSQPARVADTTIPDGFLSAAVRPHLYRYTDGQPPDAPAGDDVEPRPQVFVPEQPFYQVVPAPPPPPTVTTTTVTQPKPPRIVHKRGKPAIDHVTVGKPIKSAHGLYTLLFTFQVNSPIRIGIEGFDWRGRVVANTRIVSFHKGTGRLVLTIDPKHLPKRIAFYPLPKKKATSPDAVMPALHVDLLPIVAFS